MTTFTEDETRRYSRQLLLDGFGVEGQCRLRDSRVIVVGAGGLGSPVAYYLAAAGVDTIALADGDRVDLSNLQRQILHTTADLGRAKVESARDKLVRLNPNIKIDTYQEFLTPETAPEIFKNYDFVVECSDNFQTKYLVNDACIAVGKPFSLGGIRMLGGQTMTHIPGTACYRCLFPIEPDPSTVPNSSSVGVLGSAVGIIGSIQATETIKYITGIGTLLTDRLLVADASTMTFNTISLPRNPKCPLCSEK